MGGARSKNSIFSRFRVPFELLTAYRKQFYPKPVVPMESRGVPFASLESLWPGLWQKVPKSGHVTITKIEELHIGTRRKIHWFQERYSFISTRKNNAVIAEKPFPNSGVTRRLAVLNWRSSSIRVSCSLPARRSRKVLWSSACVCLCACLCPARTQQFIFLFWVLIDWLFIRCCVCSLYFTFSLNDVDYVVL